MIRLEIPDEVLTKSGVDEKKLKIELACALFAQKKLDLWPAARLAGLSRVEMEDELADRHIAIYYIDEAYWEQERKAHESMRKQWPSL